MRKKKEEENRKKREKEREVFYLKHGMFPEEMEMRMGHRGGRHHGRDLEDMMLRMKLDEIRNRRIRRQLERRIPNREPDEQ